MTTFPSVSSLYSETWRVSKQVGLKLVGLYILLQVVMSVVGGVLFGIYALANIGTITQIISKISTEGPSVFASLSSSPVFIISTAVFVVLYIVLAVLAGTLIQGSMVVLVDRTYTNTPVGFMETIKYTFGRIWPIWILGTISSLLILGGQALFVIPGLIMAVLFGFSWYEVLLQGLGWKAALRESARVMRATWTSVLGRMLLTGLIFFSVYLVFMMIELMLQAMTGGAASSKNVGTGLGMGLGIMLFNNIFQLVFEIVILIASVTYGVVLYHQAKEAAKDAPAVALRWTVVVAIIGWIIAIVMMALTAKLMMDALPTVIQQMEAASAAKQNSAFSQNGTSSGSPSKEELQRMMQQYQNVQPGTNSALPGSAGSYNYGSVQSGSSVTQ